MDHRGRRELRVVDRQLCRVRAGESRPALFLPLFPRACSFFASRHYDTRRTCRRGSARNAIGAGKTRGELIDGHGISGEQSSSDFHRFPVTDGIFITRRARLVIGQFRIERFFFTDCSLLRFELELGCEYINEIVQKKFVFVAVCGKDKFLFISYW